MAIPGNTVETLQAQAASFAAELHDDWRLRDQLYEDLGSMTVGTVLFDDEPVLRTEYLQHLERTMRTAPDSILARAEMAAAYAPFAEPVGGLLLELAPVTSPEGRKEHPGYLGSGSFSDVFSMRDGSTDYAVKIPRLPTEKLETALAVSDAERTDHYAIAAYRGRGIPRLEQVAAISYAAGIVVSGLLPGKSTKDLTVPERSGIQDEHLIDLARMLQEAEAAGVVADLRSKGNLLYDPDAGFGLVDYLSVDHPLLRREDEEPVLPRLIRVLCHRMLDDPKAGGAYFELSHRVRDIFVDEGFTDEESSDFINVA